MEVLLDIIKYTIPALVVFFTVYFLQKRWYEYEAFKLQNENAIKNKSNSLPLKLQAYERIALFLERIRISHLLYRLQTPEMLPKQLCNTLIVAIHQELEHNMVQQIYVSQNLWGIVMLAKDEVLHEINEASQKFPDEETKSGLQHYLFSTANIEANKSIDIALSAIKKEIQLLL